MSNLFWRVACHIAAFLGSFRASLPVVGWLLRLPIWLAIETGRRFWQVFAILTTLGDDLRELKRVASELEIRSPNRRILGN